ncbi:MAG: DUF4239 domain-containing protein [Sphingomicrobium sp.]
MIFSLPLFQLTALVLAISLALGLGLSVGIRKLFRLNPTAQQSDLAIDLMQVASSYIGILLAFAGVLAWQNYATAQTAVEQEAGAASQLYRGLTVYGPEMDVSRDNLRAYIGSIVSDEWAMMRESKRSALTEARMITLFDHVAAAQPSSERESALFGEALSHLNNLVQLRRDRLSASQAELPAVLWVVAIIGSIFTIAYASAFVSSRYATLMMSGVSLTIGLMFLFLLSVAHPFRGSGGLSPQPLTDLSAIMDSVDRIHRAEIVSARARPPA